MFAEAAYDTELHIADTETALEILMACEQLLPHADIRWEGARHLGRVIKGRVDHLLLQFNEAPAIASIDRCSVRFSLFDVDFIVRGPLRRVGSDWHVALPFTLSAVDQRRLNRLLVPHGTATLKGSKLVNGVPTYFVASVRDFSVGGAKLFVGENSANFPVDSTLPVLLTIDGQGALCSVNVRYSRHVEGGAECGVSFSSAAKYRASEAYINYRFPSLVSRTFVDPETLSNIMKKSGYLDLRGEGRLSEQWLKGAGNQNISGDMVYRSRDGQFIGHISVTRGYSNTWIGQQLATLKDHPEKSQCRQTLYNYMASLGSIIDGPTSMLVAYFNQTKKWHQIFFGNFPRWVNSSALSVIVALDRFEVEASKRPIGHSVSPGVEVREAEEDDLVNATALIRAQLPTLAADAFDIYPERLKTSCLHPAYQGSPFLRERHVFVLCINDVVRGVALCETGSTHLSLFNILNMAQLFFCTGKVAPSIPAQIELLRRVRLFYGQRDLSEPVIVAPTGTFTGEKESGMICVETMGCMVQSGFALKQYQSYLNFQFGRYRESSVNTTPNVYLHSS